MLDYWRWAASELLGNTERGRLAEFLVAKAVGATAKVRREWDTFDILTPDDVTIEVKSCAYVQVWAQSRPSSITFGIGPARGWDAETGRYESERKRHAQVYVFALLGTLDNSDPDPLDVSQWTFYVLPAATLNERAPNQRSISLNGLKALGPQEVGFDGLADAVKTAVVMRIDRSFICPECGSAEASLEMMVTRQWRPDDPWSAVLQVLVCGDCGNDIPAHLGERWDGISVEQAQLEWQDVYRPKRVRRRRGARPT